MGKGKRAKKRKRGERAAGSREPVPKESGGGDSPPERPQPTTYDWVRENLEAIIVAFILALIIRHFSVEAFEIPTGSMAPTLFGIHAWARCPNCDTDFNVGLPTDTRTGELQFPYVRGLTYRGECPGCGMPHQEAFTSRVASRFRDAGDRFQPGHIRFACQSPACDETWIGDVADFRDEEVLAHPSGRAPRLLCPICDLTFSWILTPSNRTGGHKILVNKFAYRLEPPRRWDIIVFEKDEEHNYIKRLLGLPGETVSLRGGDLYVKGPQDDEFHIERKIDRAGARNALWFLISNTRQRERGYNPEPAWKEIFERGSGLAPEVGSKWWSWDDSELRWSVNVLQPKDRIAILRYNRPCVNTYNYNLLRITPQDRPEEVGDRLVRFTVSPSRQEAGRGWIGGEMRDGTFTYQFRIPVGEPREDSPALLVRLPTDEDPDHPSPARGAPAPMAAARAEAVASLPLMVESEIEFENSDDRVSVSVNGTDILALEYESGSPALHPLEHYLQLLASRVSANFSSIRLYRDIYYTHARDRFRDIITSRESSLTIGSTENEVGVDEYFPCGDNSPASSDGRVWGTVPARNMMGKAFMIFWPIWLESTWQCGFIR